MTMTAACVKIFEDIGTDPHPPTVAVTELIHYVPPPEAPATADGAAASPQGRSIAWDSGGFTLATDQLFQIRLSYSDAGGDIVKFQLRDRDGSLNQDLLPFELTYFSGTSGTVVCPETGVDPVTGVDNPTEGIVITGIYGRHRLELWAEDSHGSRSEKVEFIITLAP